MFATWKGPLFKICTLSDYTRLTFEDFFTQYKNLPKKIKHTN